MITKSLLKYLTSFTMIMITQTAIAAPKAPIAEERLTQCYKNHPFLMQSLMLLSDQDYADQKKSLLRKEVISKEFAKSPTEIRSCVDDIIQYAKEQNDPENLKFVISRLKETTSIVYTSTTQKNSTTSGTR